MYLLDFVNSVRGAQKHEPLEALPAPGADGSSPLELAMGCRLEHELMRLSSPRAAAAVAQVTGLPVGVDRCCVALPNQLCLLVAELLESRSNSRANLRSVVV